MADFSSFNVEVKILSDFENMDKTIDLLIIQKKENLYRI